MTDEARPGEQPTNRLREAWDRVQAEGAPAKAPELPPIIREMRRMAAENGRTPRWPVPPVVDALIRQTRETGKVPTLPFGEAALSRDLLVGRSSEPPVIAQRKINWDRWLAAAGVLIGIAGLVVAVVFGVLQLHQ